MALQLLCCMISFFKCKTAICLLYLVLSFLICNHSNFQVCATAQRFQAKTLANECPSTQDEFTNVRSELLQNIGPLIENILRASTQSPPTQIRSTATSPAGQTFPSTDSTTSSPDSEPTTDMGQRTTLPTAAGPCQMTESMYVCNGTPGWRQVAFINMTDLRYDCPTGLSLKNYSKRACGRGVATIERCWSTVFSVGGFQYSNVSGRIRAYQVGRNYAFHNYYNYISMPGLESFYVDGVSVTHGAPGSRKHIWTFASGYFEEISFPTLTLFQCRCDNPAENNIPPPFVGNDYFCESGTETLSLTFHGDDPLWDGQNCISTSTCCQFNNPPWFFKVLPTPTTDDIELRICCSDEEQAVADVAVELIELYIQ